MCSAFRLSSQYCQKLKQWNQVQESVGGQNPGNPTIFWQNNSATSGEFGHLIGGGGVACNALQIEDTTA